MTVIVGIIFFASFAALMVCLNIRWRQRQRNGDWHPNPYDEETMQRFISGAWERRQMTKQEASEMQDELAW